MASKPVAKTMRVELVVPAAVRMPLAVIASIGVVAMSTSVTLAG